MDNFSYKKVLIVRLSSLGDILLITPLIRSIKKENTLTEIHFLLRSEYKDSLVHNPYISKLITLSRAEDASAAKSTLSQNNYDLIIDLQNNFRSRNLISDFSCAKVYFKKYSLQKLLLVKFKINLMKNAQPIPERYAAPVPGFKLDDEGLDLFTQNNPDGSLKDKQNLIGFCPGSRHFTKMWPLEYYTKLGKILIERGFEIVLFGGKDDQNICKEISSNVSNCVNLCNNNDLLQTAADIKKCKAVVSNDSGLMHVSCALNVPVIAIFGSTVKEFGFTPYRCKNLVLENKSLTCRPCSHIGRNHCPRRHFKCMKEITPQIVYNSINSLLNQ